MTRLKVDLEEVNRQPKITDMLKRIFKKPHKCVETLRFSGDPAALDFIAVYDKLPVGERDRIAIEAICVKAKVNSATLLGVLMIALRETNAKESAMLAMAAHPGVVQTTIKYANTPGGDKDRRLLHEAVGFLPGKAGSQINVNLLGGNPQYGLPEPASKDDDRDEEAEEGDTFCESFPSINGTLESWGENRRSVLEKLRT